MFWKYTLFEAKLLLHNRKSWFIALFLLLFYLVFFIYYSQVEPKSLIEQKREDKLVMNATFEHVDYLREDIPEVAEIYDILTQQSSLLNFQVYYLGIGDDSEQYIENGLQLNQLRLKVHELGNKGIPEHLIPSKEDILKEDALLHYIKEHQLPIETESFMTNHFFVNALTMMSGLLFLVIVLLSGSELLLYEKRHQTVVKGFPLSFINKVNSKVMVQFIYLYSFLLIGFALGGSYIVTKLQGTDFSFPILIYQNDDYVAVPPWQYLSYIFLGLALVTLLLLYLSILLNMLFQNAFANILIGLGIFILPDLIMATGLEATILHPIKFIDIANVLSGDLAVQLGNSSIDYGLALIWIACLTLLLGITIYLINKYMYLRKPKDTPLEKAF